MFLIIISLLKLNYYLLNAISGTVSVRIVVIESINMALQP